MLLLKTTYLTCHIVSLLNHLVNSLVNGVRKDVLYFLTRIHCLVAKRNLLLLHVLLRWRLFIISGSSSCTHILLNLLIRAVILSLCTSVLVTR